MSPKWIFNRNGKGAWREIPKEMVCSGWASRWTIQAMAQLKKMISVESYVDLRYSPHVATHFKIFAYILYIFCHAVTLSCHAALSRSVTLRIAVYMGIPIENPLGKSQRKGCALDGPRGGRFGRWSN